MNHFLHALIDPTAVLMLFVILYAFSVHIYPVATESGARRFGVWPILWIILGILALIAWLFLVL